MDKSELLDYIGKNAWNNIIEPLLFDILNVFKRQQYAKIIFALHKHCTADRMVYFQGKIHSKIT